MVILCVRRVLPQGVPAYVDVIGNVYTHHGEFLQRGDVNAYSSPDGEHCQCKTSNGSFVSFELSGDLIQLRCPHIPTACRMATEIRAAKSRRDSLGGIVFTLATNVPVGIGEPCFDKVCTDIEVQPELYKKKGFIYSLDVL